ncbi:MULTISPECIES: hypothetical protein [Burkholderia]|nr:MULTISPECIES: hypothetical protein [Burkholderia]
MMSEHFRPDLDAQVRARKIVRARFPMATSAYVESGAVIYDDTTGNQLGMATSGDWAVEIAWQDAAQRVSCG